MGDVTNGVYFESDFFKDTSLHFSYNLDYVDDNKKVFPHWHEEIEILYFKTGKVSIVCDQEKFVCKPGEILFVNSYIFHGLENISADCEYFCFASAPDLFQINVNKAVTLPPYFVTSDERVRYLLESVAEEYKEKELGYETLIPLMMTSILVYISRLSSGKNEYIRSNGDQNDKIRKAIIYINEHLTEPLSLDMLCEVTCLSRTHFSRTFKAFTGKSLVEYINYMRCQYARNLFLTGKYTVAECAEKVGYNNVPYFSRKYHQIYGKTISQDVFPLKKMR